MTEPYDIQPPTDDRPLALIEARAGESPFGIEQAQIEQVFRRHGAILLRGFDYDVAGFRRFAERLCRTSVFNESPNRQLLDADANIQTVDRGVDAFPLHPELSREPWRPDACLFACFDPPGVDGETTICDGTTIVERMPPALVEAMEGRRLLYIQPATEEVLQYWLGTANPPDSMLAATPPQCPYWFRRAGGKIVRGFSRPLLERPMFDQRLAFANFLLFARDYLRIPNFPCLDDGQPVPEQWIEAARASASAVTYAHAWQAGDLIVIDNSRFMHGRRAITDPRARRIASYFGYVGFAPDRPEEPVDPIWRREQFVPPQRQRR